MDVLNLNDFTTKKINEILDRAQAFRDGKKVDYQGRKVVANLFFEPSTRTHYSFDMAALKLGCRTQNFNAGDSSIKKGETLYDTVKTFEMFGVDAVVIRHKENEYYNQLVGKLNIPILNAGDGTGNHPSQSLLDLLTIRQEFGKFEGLKIVIVGDIKYSRVAHTNIEIMKKLGMEVYISGPEEYREEGYGLNKNRVNKMKEKAIIMHPAPFNRNVEITDDIVECSKSRIFKQVQNGVFVRMALINMVLGE